MDYPIKNKFNFLNQSSVGDFIKIGLVLSNKILIQKLPTDLFWYHLPVLVTPCISNLSTLKCVCLGTADVAVLDASDVYTAGLNYDLIPFVSEVYNLENAEYYVVAVAKESDPDTELTYLRSI